MVQGRHRGQQPADQDLGDVLWAFHLFRFGGADVEVHYTFFLLLFIQVFAVTLTYQDRVFNALVFILYGPVLFLTLLIHEMGHAFATRNLGGTVDRIVLWPLGGFSAVLGPLHGVVSDELWVSIAGPITHIFQGGFWVAIYAAVEKGDFSNFTTSINLNNLRSEGFQGFMSALCVQAIVGNLILFVFNLAIPAFPLDGGRALLALLVMGEVKIQAAAKITGATGFISGVALLVVGIYFYLANTSAGALFLVLIGMFLVHFGLQLLKHVAANRLSEHPLCCRDCYHELLGVRTVNNGSQDVSEVSQERRRRPYGAYEIS